MEDFREHFEDDDFFQAYGNPVVVRCENDKRIVAVAWPLAERMMRAEGRGDEADKIIRRAEEMRNDEKMVRKGMNESSTGFISLRQQKRRELPWMPIVGCVS